MLKIFTHLADWLTFEIMNLTSGTKIADAVHFFIEDTSKIFVLLAAMIYVVGFIRAGVDANRIRDYLVGKNRILCYVLAAILGAVTPFCSCSSIPLFLGFMAARIPVGIAMAFLITSPCVNEAAVAMFASSLGWTLTSVYVALGVMSGIVGGWFFDLIRAERLLAVGNAQKACCRCSCSASPAKSPVMSFKNRAAFAAAETKDVFRRIWLWVLFGIAIGAGLHGFVPDGFIAGHLGEGQWWTVPAAVLIGIPTYANVTSVIPIAGELINQGLPVGTAFAFMLSTAAASVPEFIMLKKIMTGKLLALFGAYLFVYFVICGWILNFVY